MERLPVLALTPMPSARSSTWSSVAAPFSRPGRAPRRPTSSSARSRCAKQRRFSSHPTCPASRPRTAPACVLAESVSRVLPATRGSGSKLALGVDEVVEPTDSDDAFVTALRGPVEVPPGEVREPDVPPDVSAEDFRSGGVLAVIGSKGAPGRASALRRLPSWPRNAGRVCSWSSTRLGGGWTSDWDRSPAGFAARTSPEPWAPVTAPSASCSTGG